MRSKFEIRKRRRRELRIREEGKVGKRERRRER
jgi:hypothetical protein